MRNGRAAPVCHRRVGGVMRPLLPFVVVVETANVVVMASRVRTLWCSGVIIAVLHSGGRVVLVIALALSLVLLLKLVRQVNGRVIRSGERRVMSVAKSGIVIIAIIVTASVDATVCIVDSRSTHHLIVNKRRRQWLRLRFINAASLVV
jgi:hypothetical protein